MSDEVEQWLAQAEEADSIWAASYQIDVVRNGRAAIIEYDDDHENKVRLLFDTKDITMHAIDLLKVAQEQLAKLPREELVEIIDRDLPRQNENPLLAIGAQLNVINGRPVIMLHLGSTFVCVQMSIEAVLDLRKSIDDVLNQMKPLKARN